MKKLILILGIFLGLNFVFADIPGMISDSMNINTYQTNKILYINALLFNIFWIILGPTIISIIDYFNLKKENFERKKLYFILEFIGNILITLSLGLLINRSNGKEISLILIISLIILGIVLKIFSLYIKFGNNKKQILFSFLKQIFWLLSLLVVCFFGYQITNILIGSLGRSRHYQMEE